MWCTKPGKVRHAAAGAGPDRHLQRVEDQLGAHAAGGAPAQDPPAEGVDDERHVDEPGPGGHVAEVGHPQCVRPAGVEVALDQICRPDSCRVRLGGAHRAAAVGTAQPEHLHQPLHGAAGHRDAFPVQRQPHLPGAVNAVVLVVHPGDRQHQLLLPQLGRGDPSPGLDRVVVGAGGDRHPVLGQHPADRLDPPTQPVHTHPARVPGDESHNYRCGRSSSAAKKPAAALRISFARRNSRFSARNRRISAES